MKGKTNEVEVMGHLPINHLNIGYELISRDSQDATLQFVPFSFVVKLPPLRKARLIIERNEMGQILQARAPYVRTRQFKT